MANNFPYIRLIQLYEKNTLKVLVWLNENENGLVNESFELFCEPKHEKTLVSKLSVLDTLPFEPIDYTIFQEKLFEWVKINEIEHVMVHSYLKNDAKNLTMIKKRIIEQENNDMIRLKLTWQENITH